MVPSLAQLQAFVAVVDTGSFRAAARLLKVGQSAVSHNIAALESRLKGRVLLRRTPPVRTTALGAVVLLHARQVIAATEQLTSATQAFRRDSAVELVIGAPPTLYNGLLPDLLDTWGRWHPDVTVSALMGEDTEVARWLAEGDADMAVLVDPDPVPEGALLLLKDDFRYALASVHPLAAAPGVRRADLDDDVHRLSDGGVERYLRELHERSDRPYVEPPRVREFKTLLDMVAKNQAVGLVPGFARRMLPPGVVLAPTEPKVYRRLYLTGPENRPWLPVVRDLIANAAGLLPDYVSNGEDADGSPVWR